MLNVKEACYDELPDEFKKTVSNNGSGAEWAGYLIVSYNDKVIKVFSDAMEPEDAKFCRDLKWIKELIEEAYKIGLSEGLADVR